MKVMIKVNHEIIEFEINKNKNKKVDLGKKSSVIDLSYDNYSNFLYCKIQELLGVNKNKFFLKYKNLELYNDENLLKILNEDEDCYLDLYWNEFLCNFVKVDINSIIYMIPEEVFNDSKLISEVYSNNDSTVVFKNDCLKKDFLINDWIRLSYKIKNFMERNKLAKLGIPSPIIQGATFLDKEKILENYIGIEANKYLNSLKLERLIDLAKAFDYLEAEDLLDAVCANIAIRFVMGKNIEDIKKMNLF